MQKGKIAVTTENIFPIIKKFLYSEHEIFLRELISNAIDATQKLKTLASVGDYKEELGNQRVKVSLNAKKKTLTVSDSGIGMTGDEIKKFINQIAFSSAEEFLEKYKNQSNAIIGHFGLGFYSSFMVSKKVEILTKSYRKGTKAVKWSCDGSPEYTLDEVDKKKIGTDVILYLDKESEEFLEESRIEGMLTRYCRFLPVEIAFGKEKEWKDDKHVETGKDKIINETNPLWTKKPVDLKRWGGIVILLSGPQSRRVITTKVKTLKSYGLDAPSMIITLQIQGQNRPVNVIVGDHTPDEKAVYIILKEQQTVYLVDHSWFDVMVRLVREPPEKIIRPRITEKKEIRMTEKLHSEHGRK
jgi:hypothetical protein